ncbi:MULTISPECIES: FadR/GntR family transcriptional regulator [unclassified Streptomyces]|uniref:FadR/GntR family transcriptional regulator n=1 Tax=Streptomyces johnsoniae TaxID=3075532 RepID=A0ABU2S862_9ACTN|nr:MULTISPECIES: FadR/GntR family transcriptional regulator [unclassified Streptomyces]MDT0445179.1 FadR/GntR family transcriptional regulator [Streptomyces sp. DSM 41886]ONK12450.1 L-lactate utilization operon repressor [Streptomyces sp. MP131-18]
MSSERISQRVVQQFQQMMREGVLHHGDKLPAERELAEQFSVSRNSVREALRQLDMLGLVESRHGEGTFVRQPTASQLMAPFQAVIELSTPAVDSVMEFRMAFEPGVASLAAANLTPDGEEMLTTALLAFERAVDDGGPVETVDADFHLAVARVTGNTTVLAVHTAVYQLLHDMRSRLDRSSYHPHDKTVAGHRAVYDAIVARDPDLAGRVMREHLADVAGDLRGPAAREVAAE